MPLTYCRLCGSTECIEHINYITKLYRYENIYKYSFDNDSGCMFIASVDILGVCAKLEFKYTGTAPINAISVSLHTILQHPKQDVEVIRDLHVDIAPVQLGLSSLPLYRAEQLNLL